MPADEMGTVYIIKFVPAFKNCYGYIGWTRDLAARLMFHRTGKGAKICAAAVKAGCHLHLVYDTPGTRAMERKMKNWRNCRKVVKWLEDRGMLNTQRMVYAYHNGPDKLPKPLTLEEMCEND